MRAIGLSDLDMAARAVMAVPQDKQRQFAEQILEDAHTSDLWRKRCGRAHPNGGTGSLYAQASLQSCDTAKGGTGAYCSALSVVLQALEAWRDRNHKVV